MKILFVNDAPLIKYGIALGLEKAGAEIKIFALWRVKEDQQEAEFARIIEEFKPDFVFAEGHPGLHQRSFFNCIKRMNIKFIYWAIEDPKHIGWISMPYAKHSKLVLTTAVECVPKYEAEGLRADTLLFACDPDIHYTVEPVEEYKHDIVFVGSNYDIRYDEARAMIMPFIEKGYDIKVWGLWWQDPKRPVYVPDRYYGGMLPYEELSKVYSSAKIVLGLHCDGSSVTQTSMRTYEALGCGAFYLTYYTQAHEHLFEYNKHLVWSKSAAETLQLADYFLRNAEERQRIAEEGRKFVYENHTYRQRAEQILKITESIL